MSFRDPLVVLRPYPASTPDFLAIARAVRMAAAVAPRVSAIACGVSPKAPRSVFGNALFNVAGLVGEEKKKSALDAEELLSRFSEEVAGQGLVLGDIIAEMRAPAEVPAVLADHARLYDLSIVPMPEGNYLSHFDAQWYAETIVFGSGHPTIVVPGADEALPRLALDTIIVAWDKGSSAARAIADALPLLRVASQVRLLTVTGEKQIVSARSAAELTRHLALQDVENVVVDEVDAAGSPIGEVLGSR